MSERDLHTRIDAYFDGNIDAADFADFAQTLREDPIAARSFAHRSVMHRGLRRLHTHSAQATPCVPSVPAIAGT